MKKFVWMFSGEGSQYYQMAEDLYSKSANFRAHLQQLDELVLRQAGLSVIKEVFDPARSKADNMDQIRLTHPALFCIQHALASTLLDAGKRADYVLGMSLGELVAAAVGGAVATEEALGMVIAQSQIFTSVCPPGGMLAILDSPSMMQARPDLFAGVELAGINYGRHFVVAGAMDRLSHISDEIIRTDGLGQLLPVKFGFHSSLIDPAQTACLQRAQSIELRPLQIPMVSCMSGNLVDQLSPQHFWQVARGAMHFQEAFRTLEQSCDDELVYVDLGPGGTMANFVKRNLMPQSRSKFHSIVTPFGQDKARLDEFLKAH
ncbi:acyltransferase domain-containing protein [soil metagenome]